MRFKKIFLLIAAIVLLALIFPFHLPQKIRAFLDRQNSIKTFTITSAYQKSPAQIRVLFPRNMDPNKHYPVLYILPSDPVGWKNDWDKGLKEAFKWHVADRYSVICVSPSLEKIPWYADHPQNPKIRQESYITNMVVPFIDHTFPTIKSPDGRLLLGFSKSGWGAFALLLRHPQMFGKAASFDAPMMLDTLDIPDSGLEEIFPSLADLEGYKIPNLLSKQFKNLKNQPPRLILLGYSLNKKQNEDLHIFMQHLNIPHIYANRLKYRHRWDSGWMKTAVQDLLAADKEQPSRK